MGVPKWSSPYTYHTGSIWACYLSPTWVLYGCAIWVLYGRSIWESPYTPHTRHILDCYLGPTWVHYGQPISAFSVWDIYGRAHKGDPVYITHGAHIVLLSGSLLNVDTTRWVSTMHQQMVRPLRGILKCRY